MDLVKDPRLAPHFEWDAKRLYKYNAESRSYARFINEPVTADDFWKIQVSSSTIHCKILEFTHLSQSKLPPGGKPLAFIIYADKNKLSSFGTQKGYPVIARLANLPLDIINSTGIGGGRVVGWLEVVRTSSTSSSSSCLLTKLLVLKKVEENAKDSGKTAFANYKAAVWHKSFEVLLESIREYSHSGHMTHCGDDIWRWLFPLILILTADYEEQ
jgi:hypothetical protein